MIKRRVGRDENGKQVAAEHTGLLRLWKNFSSYSHKQAKPMGFKEGRHVICLLIFKSLWLSIW